MREMTEKLKHWFLTFYLIAVPLAFSSFSHDRQSQEHFFEYMAMAIVALFIGNIWLTGFLLLNIVSYVHAGEQVGSMQVLNIFFGCLLFRFSASYFKKRDVYPYFKPLLWLLCLNLFWMVLQKFNIDPLFMAQDGTGRPIDGPHGDPTGFFGIKMANGVFITIGACILAFFNPILALFMAIPVALLRSSAVFLSFFSVTAFLVYYLYRRMFIWVMAIFALLAGAGILHDQIDDPGTFGSRLPMWHCTIKHALKNQAVLIGWGPDSFRNITKQKKFLLVSDENREVMVHVSTGENEAQIKYYSPTNDTDKLARLTTKAASDGTTLNHLAFWDNPHNEYIQMFFQYGIIGLLLLIGLMRDICERFYFATRGALVNREIFFVTAVLIVFFVSSLTQFPLGLARLGYLFPIFLGAFYAKTEEYA